MEDSYILVPAETGMLEQMHRTHEPGKFTIIYIGGQEYNCYLPGRKRIQATDIIPVMREGRGTMVDTCFDHNHYITGDLRIDIAHCIVWRGHQVIHIPPTEMSILKTLILNRGQYVRRHTLMLVLERRLSRQVAQNTLYVHVSRLRKLLGSWNGVPYVVNQPTRGYKWNLDVDVQAH